MNWSSQESAPLPQANFKMGGFSDSEAGRLNCYRRGNPRRPFVTVQTSPNCYTLFAVFGIPLLRINIFTPSPNKTNPDKVPMLPPFPGLGYGFV